MSDEPGGRRRAVPAAEIDEMLRGLPPVDVEQWNRDRREIDILLGDVELDDPDEDRRRQVPQNVV